MVLRATQVLSWLLMVAQYAISEPSAAPPSTPPRLAHYPAIFDVPYRDFGLSYVKYAAGHNRILDEELLVETINVGIKTVGKLIGERGVNSTLALKPEEDIYRYMDYYFLVGSWRLQPSPTLGQVMDFMFAIEWAAQIKGALEEAIITPGNFDETGQWFGIAIIRMTRDPFVLSNVTNANENPERSSDPKIPINVE